MIIDKNENNLSFSFKIVYRIDVSNLYVGF